MSAQTRCPHLDLEDLIAEAAGQTMSDGAREHLACCEHCRTEANRWNLVAAGVRGLAAGRAEVAPRSAGPRRRTMLAASAAAGLVLLGGVGYGVTAAVTGHARGPGAKAAALTAVRGCATLEQVSGALEQVNGSNVVISAAGGKLVTVSTTATSMVSVSGALLSDITDGAPVSVAGPSSDGTIAARIVKLGLPTGTNKPAPPGAVSEQQTSTGIAAARGTVADASAAGFTVVTSAGARVPVTTSSDTLVSVVSASLSQLQAGATTVAVGYPGPDGTLSAVAVVQPPAGVSFGLTVQSCSPASVNKAITTAFVSAG
jgi:hypothetical protein